jgi:glutathione S-transferase
VLGIVALKSHLALDCEQPIDLGRGDQLTPQYLALNPHKKMPTLEDDGFVLWESNAILFYMAAKRPDRGLWPSDLKGQAHVLRWLAWVAAVPQRLAGRKTSRRDHAVAPTERAENAGIPRRRKPEELRP